jgi:hypothetical protein
MECVSRMAKLSKSTNVSTFDLTLNNIIDIINNLNKIDLNESILNQYVLSPIIKIFIYQIINIINRKNDSKPALNL